jgi:predicted nucleotidyltransferase
LPPENRELLIAAARRLGPLLDAVVFVGGSTTELLITDEAAAEIRPTDDVDVIADITSMSQYVAFSARLRKLGFAEDTSEGAPICRWVTAEIVLDVMPTDEKLLGFCNRWYQAAMRDAEDRELEPGLTIRVVSAPSFCAMKLTAFRGRGDGDYMGSHDLEDFVTVVDGREELADELRAAEPELKEFVAGEVRQLLAVPEFIDTLPGFLRPDDASQARLPMLLDRLRAIALL